MLVAFDFSFPHCPSILESSCSAFEEPRPATVVDGGHSRTESDIEDAFSVFRMYLLLLVTTGRVPRKIQKEIMPGELRALEE